MKINPCKLEIAMATAGYNFASLAEVSGVSRTTLSYINNGKSCRPDVGGKLARTLGVDVTELLEQEEHQ